VTYIYFYYVETPLKGRGSSSMQRDKFSISWRSVHRQYFHIIVSCITSCMHVGALIHSSTYLHKRQDISRFAVNHIKQQLTTYRSTPIPVKNSTFPNRLSCIISQRSFLAVIITVWLDLSQLTDT